MSVVDNDIDIVDADEETNTPLTPELISAIRGQMRAVYDVLRAAPGYESRPSQPEMSALILETIVTRRFSMIEAPTGTGKSIAYLVPATLIALATKRNIAISTYTKALQKQILRPGGDYEKVANAIEAITGKRPIAAILKGRNNYVSQVRYEHYVKMGLGKELDDPEVAAITKWIHTTDTGDFSDLEETPLPDSMPTSSICVPDYGSVDGDNCFYQRAVKRASGADITITNHHSIIGRLRAAKPKEQDLVPAFEKLNIRNVIFDEAHEIERVAYELFSQKVSLFEIRSLINALANFAIQNDISVTIRGKNLIEKSKENVKKLTAIMQNLRDYKKTPDSSVVMVKNGPERGPDYGIDRKVVSAAMKTLDDLVTDATVFNDRLSKAADRKKLKSVIFSDTEHAFNLISREIKEFHHLFSLSGGRSFIQYSGVRAYPSIVQANQQTTYILRNRWKFFDSLVFVSATITVPTVKLSNVGAFDYFCRGLGLSMSRSDADFRPKFHDHMIYSSPFNYDRVRLFLPGHDVPAPNDEANKNQYVATLASMVFTACRQDTRGGIIVLCTSYSAIAELTSYFESQNTDLGGRTVIAARPGVTFQSLKAQFLADPVGSLLLGTGNFWQGVDFPGHQLTSLIIARLPFETVGDPINVIRKVSLQSWTDHLQKENPDKKAPDLAFARITIPSAVIKFKQGVGRLVRGQDDYGDIYIADSRILKHAQFLLSISYIKNRITFGQQ